MSIAAKLGKRLFTACVLFALFAFELPKFYFWAHQHNPCFLFPQFEFAPTQSPISWLLVHQAVGFSLALFFFYALVFNRKDCTGWLSTQILSSFFIALVLVNGYRLGNLPQGAAVAINLTLLAVLIKSYMDSNIALYVVVLTLPTWFGYFLYVRFIFVNIRHYWLSGVFLHPHFVGYCCYVVIIATFVDQLVWFLFQKKKNQSPSLLIVKK